jgi:carboxyl-terminal processing protease
MSTRNKTLKTSLLYTGITGLFAALTVIFFTILPIFSRGEAPEAFKARDGLIVYHKIWQTTKDTFLFTDRLKNWSQWEHKFDDKILSKADGIKYAREMLKSLNDPYTLVLDEDQTRNETEKLEGKFGGVGIQFIGTRDANGKWLETKDGSLMPLCDSNKHALIHRVLKKTPAEAAGLKSQDAIISVDGRPTVNVTMDELTKSIKGPEGTTVKLQVQRGDKVFYVNPTRRAIHVEVVTHHRLSDNLGYIRIDTFMSTKMANDCLRALKDMKNCRGYVLDLRSNLGGLVTQAQDVMALFSKSGGIAYRTRERKGDLILNAQAVVTDSMPHIAADKPLVVLVDGGSASAAEMVAGYLRDNRHVKLVGTQTFGKGLMQAFAKLDNDVITHTTMAQWLTPSGVCPGSDPNKTKHPNGLTVDAKCEMSKEFEFDTDKDNQLQRAISVLKEELAKTK